VTIGVRVNLDDERREKDKHAESIHTNVTASVLTLVGAEAVERVAQSRDVEAVSDKDEFSIDGYDGRTGAEDGGEGVVAHADTAACGGFVGDEHRLVWEHVVSCTGVRNEETQVGTRLERREKSR
jgi:hypothetical protein